MAKYSPVADMLRDRSLPVTLRFNDIDAAVGGLPASATMYREWWANHAGNPQAQAWLGVGARVDAVDLASGWVLFDAG